MTAVAAKFLALTTALLVHAGLVAMLMQQPPTRIEGAADMGALRLGSAFADLAAGRMTAATAETATPPAGPSRALPTDAATPAERLAATPASKAIETPEAARAPVTETASTPLPAEAALRMPPTPALAPNMRVQIPTGYTLREAARVPATTGAVAANRGPAPNAERLSATAPDTPIATATNLGADLKKADSAISDAAGPIPEAEASRARTTATETTAPRSERPRAAVPTETPRAPSPKPVAQAAEDRAPGPEAAVQTAPSPQSRAPIEAVRPDAAQIEGRAPPSAAVARSPRPLGRSAAFEQTNAPRAAAPRGNADRNARAGQANGRSEGAARSTGSGQNAQAAGNAAASNYPGAVMARLSRVSRPSVGTRGSAVVTFSIGPGGRLADIRIARGSGSSRLDRAALQVVRRAAPFPRPPAGAQRRFSITISGR